MHSIPPRRPWPAALLTGFLLLGLAQAAGAARPDPLDPQAAVPRLSHESAFRNYRAQRDDQLRPWKEANDEAGRIGGWRAYAREAQPPEAPASAASRPAPSAGGHRH